MHCDAATLNTFIERYGVMTLIFEEIREMKERIKANQGGMDPDFSCFCWLFCLEWPLQKPAPRGFLGGLIGNVFVIPAFAGVTVQLP